LSGVWDFAFLGEIDPDAVDVTQIKFDDRMSVPGCFDATPAYAGRRGLAAYRTRVLLEDSTPHRLIFNGVHHWCRVTAGGQNLRDHSGGFTRFSADIPPHPSGELDIVVLVDNRFDYERSPLHLEYFDWYHYGGITRPVELHRLGALWIDNLQVVTKDVETRQVSVTITYGALEPSSQTDLIITCDDQIVLAEKVNLGESGEIQRTLELSEAELWSPEAPNLHHLHARLGEDDKRERIGIRQISVRGQQICINGEPVRLLGFCRHETHPQFGCALPTALLVEDVQQLLDLGCNFVRGSHYPQDVRFLDLCDEAGICVWNESIGWQHGPEHLTDTTFLNAQLAHIDEMVDMSFNRPSVIMWGILNESHSHDPRCRPAYERLLGRLRKLDETRPVTYASNHIFDDVCLDLADIVSINGYPGWYEGELSDIADLVDTRLAHVDSSGQQDKPVIISEIGAGAVPGWRDGHQTRWSEPYQAKLLDVVIRHLFVDRERVVGLSIWQFCDGRSSEAGFKILGRPRGFNNKGVVDEYRRPKQAYEVVRQHFHAL
jgi:beta-glucuronidase